MKQSKYILLCGVLLLAACQKQIREPGNMHMQGHQQPTQPATSGIDVTSLPHVKPTEVIRVEDGDTISLTPTMVQKTIQGTPLAMYGYNGQIPGPMIQATQNATITVEVSNQLNTETTIHWHGLRLDNANDGVPDVTQDAIQPDGSYRYTVTFPDEGIYWYHPHVREDTQQELGLYGNLFVLPEDTSAYEPVHAEEILILDDILLDSNGTLAPFGKNTPLFPLMGRFGNVVLINAEPAEEFVRTVPQGTVMRLFLTNVANTRTFRFSIPGAKMKLVGSDIGRYENEEWSDEVIIAPAERYILDVFFEQSGTYAMQHRSSTKTYSLGKIVVSDDTVDTSLASSFETLHSNADVQKDIDAFRPYFAKEPEKKLRLSIDMHGMNHGMMMHGDTDGIEWEDSMPQMNTMMTDLQWKFMDEETKKENMDINWSFKVGDVIKIRITNDANSAHPMQHPVHFHGQRFLVLSMDGNENKNLVWKDTVLIPAGSSADLLFDMSNPGDWMFHCHIAEHLTNDMMGMFSIKP